MEERQALLSPHRSGLPMAVVFYYGRSEFALHSILSVAGSLGLAITIIMERGLGGGCGRVLQALGS